MIMRLEGGSPLPLLFLFLEGGSPLPLLFLEGGSPLPLQRRSRTTALQHPFSEQFRPLKRTLPNSA